MCVCVCVCVCVCHGHFCNGEPCVTFSRSSSFDDMAASITEGHQQCTKFHKLVISNILYRELLCNKPAFIKYLLLLRAY